LNAWNLLGVQADVIRDEEIHSGSCSARKLDRVRGAQRAICPQARVSQRSFPLEWDHRRRCRNQFLVVGDRLRVLF